MRKVITIEIEKDFPDGFIPPERFDEPSPDNKWGWDSKCCGCPFYTNNDEDSQYDECSLGGYEECPIKKYFE